MTRRTLLICFGLALLTLALFYRAVHFDFITFDDRTYVVQNPYVLTGLRWSNVTWALTTWHAGYWHPLTWISLIIDGQLFGRNAGGYHATNVLFHVANSVILFLVMRQLTSAEWRSSFVALLFAVHPLHVESVAWVAERKDVLSTFFFLLAIGAYGLYAARPNVRRYTLVALCFVLGLLAKPMIVTLPFVLLLLDFWPLQRWQRSRLRDATPKVFASEAAWQAEDGGQRSGQGEKPRQSWSRLVIEKTPLFIISAGFCVLTFVAQKSAGAVIPISFHPLLARLQNALLSYERYLGKVFWPHDLVVFYPFPKSFNSIELCWGAALLIFISVVAIRIAERRPYLLVGWLWFLGTLLPVIGLVQAGSQAMADRFMYMPAIGIFFAFTWGAADCFSKWRLPRYAITSFAAAILAALGWVTSIQLSYWKNGETVFRHSLAVNPREIYALGNLATAYAFQHRFREAIGCLELLLHELPNDGAIRLRLAQSLGAIGDTRRAIDEYQLALTLPNSEGNQNVAMAFNNLAWIRATVSDETLRDGEEAVRLAQRSCELTPNANAVQLDTLSAAYAERGDFLEAIDAGTRALQLAKMADDKDLCAQIEQRLELYRHQKPYRQPTR